MRTKPFFMSDENWYYFDEKEFRYKLKDNAPKKAVESYNEFYAEADGDLT